METPQENPQPPHATLPPTVLTIFGISGNLAQIKLLPALYHLMKKELLPANFKVVGVFRETSIDLDRLMQQVEINLLRKHQDADKTTLDRLRATIIPIVMDSTLSEDQTRLKSLLDQLDTEQGSPYQRLYYLAIPPAVFPNVIHALRDAGLNQETRGSASRILVEKPFGINLESAKQLVEIMSSAFSEQQIYRIDHYLAKENAQNILTFRFNNPFVEDIWGRQYIDHIQITAIESIGIDNRSNFYEGMGALRDVVQSHLLQLMSLVMMEAPLTMASETIHAEKLALLNAISPILPNHVDELAVRGQYDGYRQEAKNDTSNVETYAALSLEVNNSRWGGVPVLIRTGKALSETRTEISLVFRDRSRRNVPPNILTIRIQPNEGISIRLTAKKPGFDNALQPVDMSFNYQDSFDGENPDAYERVLIDTIVGDQSLFASSEEVLRCWEILEPVIQNWQASQSQPEVYAKGSTGPTAAGTLAHSVGSDWL